MQNIDPQVIQQFLDQYKNSQGANGNTTFTPTINVFPQEFINLLGTVAIALTVLSALFVLFYLLSLIRKWKVQSAILDMHKDVKELKAALAGSKPIVKTEPKLDSDTEKIA